MTKCLVSAADYRKHWLKEEEHDEHLARVRRHLTNPVRHPAEGRQDERRQATSEQVQGPQPLGREVLGGTTARAARKGKTMTGTIKKLIKDKKCGFIRGDDNVDYFFHKSAVKNAEFEDLGEGQEVTFEDAEGQKGPRAEDVYV